MQSRLESRAPNIAKALKQASDSHQNAAAFAAAGLAVSKTEVSDPAVLSALSNRQLIDLNTTVGSLDRRYFEAQSAGDEAAAKQSFSQARAVSATNFALRHEPEDAIYEAAVAVEHEDEIYELVLTILSDLLCPPTKPQ